MKTNLEKELKIILWGGLGMLCLCYLITQSAPVGNLTSRLTLAGMGFFLYVILAVNSFWKDVKKHQAELAEAVS